MLRIYDSMKNLPFGALMEIYAEGNRENGQELWPQEPPGRQQALAELDFHQYLRQCFFVVPGAFYALWEQEGIPVSALRLEPYRDGLLLEALETAPEHRGRGYAKSLIRAVIESLGSGKIYSHITRSNVISRTVHLACGFQKILDYAVYIDGTVTSRSDTWCLEL